MSPRSAEGSRSPLFWERMILSASSTEKLLYTKNENILGHLLVQLGEALLGIYFTGQITFEIVVHIAVFFFGKFALFSGWLVVFVLGINCLRN